MQEATVALGVKSRLQREAVIGTCDTLAAGAILRLEEGRNAEDRRLDEAELRAAEALRAQAARGATTLDVPACLVDGLYLYLGDLVTDGAEADKPADRVAYIDRASEVLPLLRPLAIA
jgi:hypothetical protein